MNAHNPSRVGHLFQKLEKEVGYKMLLVGIDLGDVSSTAGISNSSGKSLVKPFAFNMDKEGFDSLIARVEKESKIKGYDAMYLLESTNNFWMPLFYYLKGKEKHVRLVDAYDVHQMTKIQSNKAKTDPNDCRAITKVPLVEDKKKNKIVPDMKYHELRKFTRLKADHTKKITAMKNRIVTDMKVIFKGLLTKEIFSDNFSKSARLIMKQYTSPKNILGEDKDKLIGLIREESKNRLSLSKIMKIISKAKDNISLKEYIEGHIYEVRELLDLIEFYENKIEKLAKEIKNRFKQKTVEHLMTIPGLAENISPLIYAEAGGIERFKEANAYVSYIGFDVVIVQSGKYEFRGKISKQGNKYLRKAFYQAADVARRFIPEYKEYYAKMFERKTGFKPEDKKKITGKSPHKLINVAIARKLAKIAYCVMKENRPYYPNPKYA